MENKWPVINRNTDKGKEEEKQREDVLARVEKISGVQVWECPKCKQTSKWWKCMGGEYEETKNESEANNDEGRTSHTGEEETEQRVNRLREVASAIERNWKAQLQTYAARRWMSLPVYVCEAEGEPHVKHFRCKVMVGGTE